MKITVAQLNFHIGNFEGNLAKMLNAVEQAENDGSDIICFAELATCGYPPRNFLIIGKIFSACTEILPFSILYSLFFIF